MNQVIFIEDGKLTMEGTPQELWDQSFDDYLKDIKGKTAALFSLASEEGAHFAGGGHFTLFS